MVAPNSLMIPGPPMHTPQARTQLPVAPGTQWQKPQTQMPSPAFLASGQPNAGKVRGVSADPQPAPITAKFVMPSPQALGVSTELSSRPLVPLPAQVDWNQIQSRMERLGVLRFEKDRASDGVVRVRLLLPTADPTKAQPVEAQAATEAAAILLAVEHAEQWMQKR